MQRNTKMFTEITILQLSKATEGRGKVDEEVEEGWGDCGELCLSVNSEAERGFNRCVAAFTQAREAQTHKHQKTSLVRIWESREDKLKRWSTRHPDHGGQEGTLLIQAVLLSE